MSSQFGGLVGWIEAEKGDASPIEGAQALKALDCSGLACPIGSEDSEYLARHHLPITLILLAGFSRRSS